MLNLRFFYRHDLVFQDFTLDLVMSTIRSCELNRWAHTHDFIGNFLQNLYLKFLKLLCVML